MSVNRRTRSPALGVAGGVVIGVLLGLGVVLVCGCAGKAQPSSMVAPNDAAAPSPSSQGGGAGEMAEMAGDADDPNAVGEAGAGAGKGDGDGGGDGELSLAVYERLLVEQELRLRSAGVAMRGDLASVAEDSDGLAKSGYDGSSNPKKSKKSKNPKGTSSTKDNGDLAFSTGNGAGGVPAGAEEEQSASQRICELAAATCDLERQICNLAARHPDEERYAQVCQRASEDCQIARAACESRRA